jgi:type III pantothenate kinase
MKTLVFDFGNTFSKAGQFKDQRIVKEFKIPSNKLDGKFISDILQKSQYDKLAYVSTIQLPDDIHKTIETTESFVPFIFKDSPGLKNRYKSITTLGSDRFAASLGSLQRVKSQNVLTIVCGTCITYNFVNKKNEFIGGAISPGINMRLKAMHEFTSKLPQAEISAKINLTGTDTITSLLTGAVFGAASEIDGMIDRYKAKYKSLTVIISGGDAAILQRRLKNKIFAVPDLVLKGLNYYLHLNDKNF